MRKDTNISKFAQFIGQKSGWTDSPSMNSYGNGGVMYFRDPSPSHLRYPIDSYKTRTEEKKQQDKEATRWDW